MAPAVSWIVEYTPFGGSPTNVMVQGSLRMFTLTGLSRGTLYSVRLAGVNVAGLGPFSPYVQNTTTVDGKLISIAGCTNSMWMLFQCPCVSSDHTRDSECTPTKFHLHCCELGPTTWQWRPEYTVLCDLDQGLGRRPFFHCGSGVGLAICHHCGCTRWHSLRVGLPLL